MPGVTKMSKTYDELITLPTFKERFDYLKLNGFVGKETFGFDRYLNQVLYRSYEWKQTRKQVILRDNGCDLGINGREIFGKILVHHINPITLEDINNRNPEIFNLNNLITVSFDTHQAIHFGSYELLPKDPVERKPNDTCPWKQEVV